MSVAVKPPWKSKTLWFNTAMSGLLALEASLDLLKPVLPGNVYAYFSVTLIVGNAILRVLTRVPII